MTDLAPRFLFPGDLTVLEPLGRAPEPFGPPNLYDLVNAYADLALAQKASGAKSLLVPGFTGLAEARAAVLGMRQAHLPLYFSVAIDGDGKTKNGNDPLAALICLQGLGLAAFGLEGEPEPVLRVLRRLAPYACIPLTARPNGPADAARLLEAGAGILDATRLSAENISETRAAVQGVPLPPKPERPEDAPLLLADEAQVYYLEEDFTVSGAIDCELNIAEQILMAEDDSFDALLFHITSTDGAENFAADKYMARAAVSILAESEELLELALLHYTGRAIIDSRSDVDEPALLTLAKGYGAVIR